MLAVIAALLLLCIESRKSRLEVDKNTSEINAKLQEEKNRLAGEKNQLEGEKNRLEKEKYLLEAEIAQCKGSVEEEYERLEDLQKNIQITLTNQKSLSQEAFQSWWDTIEKDYQEKEAEYNQLVKNLKIAYSQEQDRLNAEIGKTRADLDKIHATRDAAIAAQIKEREIKEKLAFYCLSINDKDLDDIKRLERVKSELHSPRILSMLIWSTYFQKPMNTLCNNILGTSVVTSIYKITNQVTGECYIGQAVDTASRWKQHAKCGLGIDPPASNKLYKAMQAEGIWNFSWELLEKCSQSELNEKEKFYINLYQSYNFGYNSNSGIGK